VPALRPCGSSCLLLFVAQTLWPSLNSASTGIRNTAFEILHSSNVERRSSTSPMTPQSSGYAILQPPFENHVTKKPYHSSLETPMSANPRQQTSTKPGPSLPVADFSAETSYDGRMMHMGRPPTLTEMDTAANTLNHRQHMGGRGNLASSSNFPGRASWPWSGRCSTPSQQLQCPSCPTEDRSDSWSTTLQPTVYLSISTALANILVTYALC
jgi:hypothetical protein